MSRQVDELIQDVIDFGRRCNDLVEFTYKRTCGFSTNQMHVVVFIYRKGGSIYQKDLDDFIRLSKPAISQLVDSLVNSGLVERHQSDGDKRQRRLVLTPSGLDVAKKLSSEVRSLNRRIAGCLSSDEVASLSRILEKLEKATTI
ncbi:MAG: winged helix-turn-helix transcriptional regulator [Spirochaetes bacterium]|uniref:Winged helix-turn-helix transcriptional regulator n=1 Tax=Candidatus Aphodenecus pullistercoris TaxID=2840669 RepID=A0A9D9EAW5_9SPIR|nr:winged helix-turn-helix transcriptional regulator [Candidatus Aphodenecus pullistercoris]